MTVTTVYVEEEKVNLISDPDKWKNKCEELGLISQLELLEGDRKPCPFMRMDVQLQRVFEVLCPTKEDISKFKSEPIPLEALSAYGLAIKDNYFEEIQVWYSPGQPDPVMVGLTKSGSNRELFLMARWGPEKESLEGLKEKARKRWITKASGKLKSSLESAKSKLERLDELADQYLNGEWVDIYI